MAFFDDPRDQGLYRELTSGVTRHRRLLDWYIAQLIRKPLAEVDAEVLNALRLGLYQLLFLKVPEHAAVSESVELIAQAGKANAKGFVNAGLRSFLRQPELITKKRELGVEYSFPNEFLAIFSEALHWSGKNPNELEALLRAFNQRPRLCLRANVLKISRDDLLQNIKEQLPDLNPIATVYSPEGIYLESMTQVRKLPGYEEGLFTVQSEASQLISHLLLGGERSGPSLRVLDACAAPGGKTTHLAELTQDRAHIIALAPARRVEHDNATKKLKENISRLKLRSIETVAQTAEEFAKRSSQERFDFILVDAPCSGLGTISKNPERKWFFNTDHVTKLVEQQRSILGAVQPLLKEGGILVYSICSLSLPEWQVGLEFGSSASLPEGIFPGQKQMHCDKRDSFIFWPDQFESEGMFALRRTK